MQRIFAILLLVTPYASAMTQTMSTLTPASESVLHDTDDLKLSLSGSVYSTKDNLSASTLKQSLPNNGKVSLLRGTLGFDYGFSNRTSVFFDFSVMHTSVSTNSVLYPQYAYYGTSDYDLGFRHALARKNIDWFIELGLQMPAYTRLSETSWGTLNSASALPTGSGLIEPWIYTGIEYPFSSRVSLGAGLGAKYRTQSFSSEAHTALYLKYASKRNFFFKLGVIAEAPIQETTTVNSNTVLSGSLAMNSNNYSWIKADVATGYYFTNSFYSAASFQTEILGKNTSFGIAGALTLGMHFGDEDQPVAARRSREKENRFHQYFLTGSVIKFNNNLKQFLIDKGRNDGAFPGQVWDIFAPNNSDGSQGELLGRAKALESGPTRTKLRVTDWYSEGEMQEGFVVRKSVD